MTSRNCEICNVKRAEHKCKLCSRNVCEEHYMVEKGICIICRDLLCEICGNYLSISVCKYCGRLGCEKCLIQITPVEYICVRCYSTSKTTGSLGGVKP